MQRPSLAAAAAIVAATAVAVAWRYQPPSPRPASADPGQFSAERAATQLAELLGDQAPHPAGSAANAAVRGRLLEALSRLGLTPEVHGAVRTKPRPVTLQNVWAELPGGTGPLVVLAAHYDSVPEGPGAADDGAGVATLLETVRALRTDDAPRRNRLAVLITDGEELGLLGAAEFARSSDVMPQISAVLNFEARGTTGPSILFETGPHDLEPMRLAAAHLPRPVTSSVCAAVYERMPNGTDFTIFRRRGILGLNFAFLGGGERYHTARDDLAHLDHGSLQHHGDHALAMARAFANADLTALPASQGVFFDVLALGIVCWPADWAPWIAWPALLLVLLLGARHRGAARGPLGTLLAVAIATAAGYGLSWIARGTGLVQHPFQDDVALPFALYAAAAVLALLPIGRRLPFAATWHGIAVLWAVLAAVSAYALPGGSYLFVLPAWAMALAALPAAARRRPPTPAAALPAVAVTALVWIPILQLLPLALGLQHGAILAGLSAFALSPLLPLLAPPARS